MNDLVRIFLNNLLPIFLAAGTGYFLAKYIDLDPRPISKLVLYIFSPCLIFTMLTQNELGNSDILKSILYLSLVIGIVGLIAWLMTTITKSDRKISAGIILTSILMNAGNYGLPVVMFAFGETALSYAGIFFVTMAIMTYTVGIVVASMGTASLRTGLTNLIKLPLLYAIILAAVLLITGWKLPVYLDRTINLLGEASIPTMLVLLGIQLANVRFSGISFPLILGVLLRLIVSPIVALFIVTIFGITGPERQAMVIIAGMPAAVFTTVLATEYNVNPSFVTAVVLVSTLLSPLTLTPLLAFLGA